MTSRYVELMGARKAALRKGNRKEADKLYDEAIKLKESGEVTEEEMIAAAYI